MSSLPNQTNLVTELVNVASRDITAYMNADNVNRRAAAEAATVSINAAIRTLESVRRQLILDMTEMTVTRKSWSGDAF